MAVALTNTEGRASAWFMYFTTFSNQIRNLVKLYNSNI